MFEDSNDMNSAIDKETYDAFRDGLLQGNRMICMHLVQDLLEKQNIPVADLYENLFQASMYEIGALWEANKISVATEHMATAIIESLLPLIYPHLFRQDYKGLKAVISCTPNEYHQVGAKMVADFFEIHGWDACFLGANTPVPDMIKMIREKKPEVLGLSLSIYFSLNRLIYVLEEVRKHFPELLVLVGGQAFRHGGQEALEDFAPIAYVQSLKELETWMQRLEAEHVAP